MEWKENLMISKSKIIWLVVIAAIGTAFYFSNEMKNDKKNLMKAERIKEQVALKERYKKGAYIDNESKLSDYETTKTIIYPGKSEFSDSYDEMYDTTCLVYTNTQIGESKVKCSGLLFDADDDTNGDMQGLETEPRYGRYE